MTRVAVVAPVPAVRAGLSALLRESDTVTVVVDAATVTDLEIALDDVDVLVLMTPDRPSRVDLEYVFEDAAGRCALLLLTDDAEAGRVVLGLPVPAWGILSLDTAADELVAAIQALERGLIVGAPALLQPLLTPLLTSSMDPEQDTLVEPLTEREVEVLGLVAQGLANKQIAEELHISEHTVKFHVSSIYAKLGATNRAEAVRLGILQGLITL